jgi:hypothetical protein
LGIFNGIGYQIAQYGIQHILIGVQVNIHYNLVLKHQLLIIRQRLEQCDYFQCDGL